MKMFQRLLTGFLFYRKFPEFPRMSLMFSKVLFFLGVPFLRTLEIKKYETRGKLSGILANKTNKSNYTISLSGKFY